MNQDQTPEMDVKNQVRDFIIDNFLFGYEEESISDDNSFLDKGIIDSTGVLELIEFIEKKFNIKTGDDELIPENLDSLNNVSNYIIRKRNM